MKKLILIFAVWFIAINIFAVLALNRFNLKGDTAYTWIDPSQYSQKQGWNPVDIHAQWDSAFYLDIAKNGYSFKSSGALSNIVFFPLYPFLIKAVSLLTLGHTILAGWIVSTIFLFLALLVLYKLIREFHPEIDPLCPIFFLLIFPTAFFLNSIYTESLFLFLSITTFYFCFKKEFIFAGIFGLLAALTRITGIILFIPLVWEYLNAYGFAKLLNKKIISIFLIPIGTLAFFLYHKIRFGDFFLFFRVESRWGRSFRFNPEHFQFLTRPQIVNFGLDLIFVLFALIVCYFIFKKLRVSYGLYTATTLAVALSTGTFMSIGRYILVLFPIYILMAKPKNNLFKQSYALVSVLLLALYTILFVNGYWAG